ncbi:MAG: hypothetical protein V3S69_00605 [Dehalococcoidales bacterium]
MSDLVRIQAIRDELDIDPAVLGYAAPNAGVEADAIADLALMSAVGQTVDVPTLSGSQLFEAIDDTEWQALTVDEKTDVQFVVSLGDNIQIAPGTKARAMMARALAGSTASLAALGVLGSKTVSRAEELGFGQVHIGDIQHARILP